MIRINLLPFRAARKKENIRRQVSIVLLSLFFVVLVMIYYNITLKNKIEALDADVKSTKKQIAKVEKQAKEVDRIKREFDKLKKKIEVIKNLETTRKSSVHLLDNMTKMVVEKTSISELDKSEGKDIKPEKRLWFTNFSAKGNNINIRGIALDNKTVADFMTRLEISGMYRDVNLRTLKQQKVNKLKLKSFEITCKRVPLKKKVVTKKK
jgi:type IV pilus assembly protein PilN